MAARIRAYFVPSSDAQLHTSSVAQCSSQHCELQIQKKSPFSGEQQPSYVNAIAPLGERVESIGIVGRRQRNGRRREGDMDLKLPGGWVRRKGGEV